MRVLVAEDDTISRRVLEAVLKKWGYEVISVADGEAAWEALRQDDAPRLAILDWMRMCQQTTASSWKSFTRRLAIAGNMNVQCKGREHG